MRGELIHTWWSLPATSDPRLEAALTSLAGWGEGRVRVLPGVDLSVRGERLAFGDVETASGPAPWEADVTRLETGFAISVLRRVKLKGAWQHNWRPARRPGPPGQPGGRAGRGVVLRLRAVASALVARRRRRAPRCPRPPGGPRRRGPGAIRGRLDIRRLATPTPPRPGVSDFGGRVVRPAPDVRRGLVYLDTAPRSAFDEPEPGRAVMDQRNETFVPRLLAVTTGTVVDFPNSDSTYHNVFSLSRARRFDLGRYASGRSKSVRFDRPGVVRVFCDIHSHMSAFVVVFSHPYLPRHRRRRPLPPRRVPAGTYTVVGWYEGEARVQRSVTVPAGGTVELDLEVP